MADYFSQGRRRGNSVTQERLNAPLPPSGRPVRPADSYSSLRQPSGIRIRRLASGTGQTSRPASQASNDDGVDVQDTAVTGRRRSSSEPQRYLGPQHLAPPGNDLTRQRTADVPSHMRTINEGSALPQEQATPYYEATETPRPLTPSINIQTPTSEAPVSRVVSNASAMNSAGNAAQRNRGLRRFRSGTQGTRPGSRQAHDEYDSDVVDLLDLIGVYCAT